MVPVTGVRYVRDHVLWLRFSDGVEGKIDLQDELHGEVFEPLRDTHLFRAVAVHPEWRTICWPNGAHPAPEFLHQTVLEQSRRAK
jgi:hypothetical protein